MTSHERISKDPGTCPSCGEELLSTSEGKVPSFCSFCRFPLILIAGKYRLTRLLSEGGFGLVYLAHHTQLSHDAERVVKVLKPDVFQVDKHMERRFRREVQITSALSQRNEHIVRIYDDFGEEPQLGYYYVMEFLEGRPLGDIMPEGKGLDERIVFKIFAELCLAMADAHHADIIHRDLKPDNIFLERRRTDPYFVKVLDFGIAKPLHGDSGGAKMTQGAMGTPSYMAPEQCLNESVTPCTDIYSMGIILYELLTGRNPYNLSFEGTSRVAIKMIQAHLLNEPTSLTHWRPDLSQELSDVVMKALAKKPAARHQSAEAFWRALREAAPAAWGLVPLFDALPSLSELPAVEPAALPKREEALHPQGAADAFSETAGFGPSPQEPGGATVDLKKASSPPERMPLPTSQPIVLDAAVVAVEAYGSSVQEPDESTEVNAAMEAPARRLWLVGVLLGCLVVGVAGGAWLWGTKKGGGPQPASRQKALTNKASKKAPYLATRARPRSPERRPVAASDANGVADRAGAGEPRARAAGRRSAADARAPARRIRANARRPVVRRTRRRAVTGPCGVAPAGLRWIASTLQKPQKGRPKIQLPGCSRCRVKRKGRWLCLGVPRSQARTKARIVMEGQLSCVYWLTSRHKRIGWYLKYESLDSMADESYNCVKPLR